MANCNQCAQPIAWKKEWSSGRSVWIKYDPEKDEAGRIVFATVPNGKGRTVRRAKPSAVRHACAPDSPTPSPTPAPVPDGVPAPQTDLDFDAGPAPAPDAARFIAGLEAHVRATMKTILDEYGVKPPPQTIVIKHKDTEHECSDETVHPAVFKILPYITESRHVYLWGPAGSGKTYGAQQAARMIGRKAVVIPMAGITPGKLFGHAKLDGTWSRTAFAEALEYGHVAVLDEMDRCLPQVAASLNSIIENRVFVEGARVVPVHADFVAIATGNTSLRGATRTYTSAQPLDLATAARFGFIEWTYDEKHESSLVSSVLPRVAAETLVGWCRKVRAVLERDHIETVFSGPRESLNIARALVAGVSLKDAVDTWIWRGLDQDTIKRICREVPLITLPVMEASK